MILSRLGNKQAIAQDIIKYFPEHKAYIEPFFGAGGMFFNKPKAKYNIVNDIDSEVYNLYSVVTDRKEDFIKQLEVLPYHSDLLAYWKKNEEQDCIKKALRFIFLSNFVIPFTQDINRRVFCSTKESVLENTDKTLNFIKETNIRFFNEDFRLFINRIMLRGAERPLQDEATFFYCDPPYLGTANNYSNSFTEQDSIDLFDCLQATGCKFAMSEFDKDFILNQAKERGLNVIFIGERKNLKNRRTEILITNYEKQKGLFD